MDNEMTTINEFSSLTPDEFWTLLNDLKEKKDHDAWRTAIYYRCATDLEAFASIFFPHYCKYPFNSFHYDTFLASRLGERGYRKADAAPRGNAKSTIKVLIKPIHDICYKLEKFIVCISNTEDQAVSKLKDIQAELVDNEMLIDIYGRFIRTRKIGVQDFVAHNGDHSCRLLALGSGTEMRGIRFGESRPSKIILDDVEHSEEVESEHLRDKLKAWYEDVVANIGDEHTNIDFVGTVLHRQSLLVTLLKNPRYRSNCYRSVISWASNKELWDKWKAIYMDLDNDNRMEDSKKFYMEHKEAMDEGVEVLWPEKEPYYALQEKILETGIRSFMKEKQNDPMSDEEKIFTPESIWWYDETPQGLMIERTKTLIPWDQLTAYGAIDPSTGQTKVSGNSKKKPDFTAILNGYSDAKKRLFVHEDFLKRVPPTAFIQKIFEYWFQYKHYKFGVETNLYRNLLIKNLLDEKARLAKEGKEVTVKFYDIELHENKEKRIYSLEPKVFHGHILFNRRISDEFMNQLYDFPKGVHDDGPDCLEMLWGLVNNKYKVGALDKDVNR